MLNETAQDLRNECGQLTKELPEVAKRCNKLIRLLEHAVWEEDMVKEESIVFKGTTADFLELIGPFLLSRNWSVNDKHEIKSIVRTLSSVIFIRYDPKEDFLRPESLLNAVNAYLERHRED